MIKSKRFFAQPDVNDEPKKFIPYRLIPTSGRKEQCTSVWRMILIDTNVISELMKSAPSKNVIHWIDQENSAELYISTITIAEIFYGLNHCLMGNDVAY